MGIDRPFRRTCRQFKDGKYDLNSHHVRHPKYAQDAIQCQRAFAVLQKDFLTLLDYIEPAETNSMCYSYRTHELLMRICSEVEANFRAIYADNGEARAEQLNMTDFIKLNRTHRLSSYKVRLPTWYGGNQIRIPFDHWSRNERLPWLSANGSAKHNRHLDFEAASFGAVVDAMCGLVVVLSSQFLDEDYHPTSYMVWTATAADGFKSALGEYFLVKYPDDWPEEERYDFDWDSLKAEPDPFQKLRP